MKKFMLGMIVTPAGSSLPAQSIVGTQYRAVFRIATTDADKLTAVMYPSIDQTGQSLPAGAVTAFVRMIG